MNSRGPRSSNRQSGPSRQKKFSEQCQLQRVRTVGDSYMAVGGTYDGAREVLPKAQLEGGVSEAKPDRGK